MTLNPCKYKGSYVNWEEMLWSLGEATEWYTTTRENDLFCDRVDNHFLFHEQTTYEMAQEVCTSFNSDLFNPSNSAQRGF